MATEFICKIRESGGDYSSLAGWENAIDCDLTASGTKVFSGSVTGAISDGASVTLYRGGASQGVTATVLHVTINGQIGLISISNPSFSFQSGDEWRVDSSNYFTISSGGDSMIAVAEIDGTWSSAETAAVNIDGWTTSSTNYVYVRAIGDSKAGAQWSTTKYRLSIVNLGAGAYVLRVVPQYTKIQGLQVEANGITGSLGSLILSTSTTYYTSIIGCHLRKVGSGNYAFNGFYLATTNYGRTFVNNVIASNTTYSSTDNTAIQLKSGTVAGNNVIYNNTLYGFAYGVYQSGSVPVVVAKNNICQSQSVRSYYIAATTKDCDYNLSGDSYSTGGAHDKTNQTVQFVDAGNGDFHLSSSDSAARDAGTDLSGDSYYAFDVDIDGETRPGEGYWDIGADEYVTAGATYTLICSTGEITKVGQNAILNFNRLLSGETGGCSLAGNQSGLLLNRLLTAQAGESLVAGNDVGLFLNRALAGASGEVALVGNSAGLIYTSGVTYTLTCDSGIITHAGEDASLYYNRLLTAQAGSLELAGNQTMLLLNRLLSANIGIVVMAGNDAVEFFNRLLAGQTGAIMFAGNPAELIWSGQPVLPDIERLSVVNITPYWSCQIKTPEQSVANTTHYWSYHTKTSEYKLLSVTPRRSFGRIN